MDTRLDRFSYDPILDEQGNPKLAELTDHDDRRFKALAPYDNLTADYIAARSDGSEAATTNRFNILKRKPNRWIDIAQPQLDQRKRYRTDFLAYCLSDRSRQRLEGRDQLTPNYGFYGPFEHRLMAQWMRCSFDIAIYNEAVDASIVTYREIMASANTPEATRTERTTDHQDHRHQVRATFTNRQGKSVTRYVTADAHPFAIKNPQGHALVFLEADCHTESIINKEGSDLDLKLRQYIEIFRWRDMEADKRPLFRQRYGFKEAFMVFATPSVPHLENVMAHLMTLTANSPVVRKHFLFTAHPAYDSKDRPSATGHMLTNPYRRAGLPDFSLLTGEEIANGHREIKGPDRATRSARSANRGSGERGEEGKQAANL